MNDDTILIAIPHKRKDDPVATTRHYGYRKQYANTAERAAFLRRLRGTTGPGVGKTYNAEIKLDETVERVAVRHCDACGMTHLADTDHACFKHKPRPRREETVDESKKRGWLTRLFRGGQQ